MEVSATMGTIHVRRNISMYYCLVVIYTQKIIKIHLFKDAVQLEPSEFACIPTHFTCKLTPGFLDYILMTSV